MIDNILDLITYHEGQIASRSLSKKLGLSNSVLLFAFDKGESISSEKSSCDKVIQVLNGRLEVTLEEQSFLLEANSLMAIPSEKPHTFLAHERSKVLQIELPAGD